MLFENLTTQDSVDIVRVMIASVVFLPTVSLLYSWSSTRFCLCL